MNLAGCESTLVVQSCLQYWRHALKISNTDAVIRCVISEAVGNQTILIQLHRTHHVRSVTEYKISTGIHCQSRKSRDVAAWFAEMFFFGEGYVLYIATFGTAMKADDHDVVARRVMCDRRGGLRIVVQQVGFASYGKSQYRNS